MMPMPSGLNWDYRRNPSQDVRGKLAYSQQAAGTVYLRPAVLRAYFGAVPHVIGAATVLVLTLGSVTNAVHE